MTFYVTIEEARAILEHRVPAMREALVTAVHRWNVDLSHLHATLGILTRSMFINDVWHDEVMQTLVDDQGIRLYPNKERQCLLFDDQVAVRLKLLNERGRPRNNRGRRARAWQYQHNLPGLPPVVRLDFGYRLDPIGSTVESITLMFYKGHSLVWQWPVHELPVADPKGEPEFEQISFDVLEREATGIQIR